VRKIILPLEFRQVDQPNPSPLPPLVDRAMNQWVKPVAEIERSSGHYSLIAVRPYAKLSIRPNCWRMENRSDRLLLGLSGYSGNAA
jgi:hypothetical protein